MQILFIDESNPAPAQPSKNGKQFFVLAGVSIPELDWHSLTKSLNNIKAEKGLEGEIKWRFFSHRNISEDNPMRLLSKEQRDEIRDNLLSALNSHHHVSCMAVVASIQDAFQLPYVNNDDDLYYYCLKILTERFQYRIQDTNRKHGITRHGMIVIDGRDPAKDNFIREMHDRLVTQDKKFTATYENIVEGLFIGASHLSPGIQFADLIAGATYHYFASDYKHWLERSLPSFRTGPRNQYEGYGIMFFPNSKWSINQRRRVGDLTPNARMTDSQRNS